MIGAQVGRPGILTQCAVEEATELDDVTDELATELEDTLEDTADELLDGFTLALDATDELATLLWLDDTLYCDSQAA